MRSTFILTDGKQKSPPTEIEPYPKSGTIKKARIGD